MAILVAEDELDLSDLLSYILRKSGHEVILAHDGEAALRLWRAQKPELVLLDIGLPRKNGWDVCKTIRQESTTPILILSGAAAEDDIVRGLDLGAEDYLTKPFSPRLLRARINSLIRRTKVTTSNQGDSTVSLGDLKLDFAGRTVTCGAQSVQLTRIEHSILQMLAIHMSQVVPHEELVDRVWGYKGEGTSHVAKGHMRNLRMKLASIGSKATIRVLPGCGYILDWPCG